MGFIDRLGETLQDFGWTIGAPAAAIVDVAKMPFDDEDDSLKGSSLKTFGTYLDRQFQVALGDENDPNTQDDNEENLFSPAVREGVDALEWIYDELLAPAASLGAVTGQRLIADARGVEDNASPLDLGSAWGKVDENRSSPGREAAYMWFGLFGDERGLTPEGQKALNEHSRTFDVLSGTVDFGSRVFLDPLILVGKAAKVLRASQAISTMSKGAHADWLTKGNAGPFASNQERASKAVDWIVDANPSANEIVAAFRMAERADGGAIANIMATTRDQLISNGMSRDGVVAHMNLINRVGMGDMNALRPLQEEAAGAADALAALASTRNDAQAVLRDSVVKRDHLGRRLRDAEDWVQHVRDNGGYMSPERLNEFLAARSDDYFTSQEFVAMSRERLKAVKREVKAAANEASRLERLHYLARHELAGQLTENPLVTAVTGSTRGLERRAGKERLGAAGYRERRTIDLAKRYGGTLGERTATAVFQNTALNVAVKAAFPQFALTLKVADAFRSPLAPRVLGFNDPYSGTGLNNFLKSAGVDPELRASLVTEFGQRVDDFERSNTVDTAIHAALEAKVNQAAAKHNVSPAARGALLASLQSELENDALRRKFHQQQFTASSTEEGVPGDLIFNGSDPMPLLDTQTLKTAILPDLHEVDHIVRRTHNYLTDLTGWATGNRAPDPGRIQQIARDVFDVAVKPQKADKLARTAESVNNGFWRAEEVTRLVLGLTTSLWKGAMLLRPAYVARYLTDSEMRMIAKLGVTSWAVHAVPGLGNAALAGAPGRISQSFAAHRDHQALLRIRAEIEKAEDADLDPTELRAAAKEIEARLATSAKGRKGRREAYGSFGARKDEDIQTALGPMASAALDPYGHSLAWQIQGKTTAALAGDVYKTSYADLMSDGWRTITNDDPTHLDQWTHAVNAQILKSKIVKKVLENDFDTAKTVAWLKRTPEGRALREQLPWTAANAKRWVEEVEGMVLHYLPSDELLATAKKSGVIARAQLERAIPDTSLRPPVHGESVALTTGRGSTASKTINETWRRLFNWMGDVPEDRLARHPFYRAAYEQELKRRAEHVLANPYQDHYTLAELHELTQKQAHKYAREQIKKYMFDVASTSDLAHALRFASPFVKAWEDTVRKWGRIALDDPSVPARLYQIWNAPGRAGFTVVDEEGNAVDKGNFNDSHFILLQTPEWLGGKRIKLANSHMRLPKQSVNIILQGGLQPGFGPLVAYPVGEFSKNEPKLDEFASFVNPFGPPESVWDAIAPSTAKRVQELFSEQSGRHADDTARMYRQMMLEYRQDPTRYPPPDPKVAAERAKSLGYLKILNNFVNPFPVTFDSPYKFYEDTYRALKAQEADPNAGHEQGWADDTFYQEYGEAFFSYVQSRSRNNAGGLANAATVDAQKKYSREIAKYGLINGEPNPSIIRLIVGPEGQDPQEQFNQSAYAWQQENTLAPGANVPFRDKKNYLEASADADVKLGWYKFRQFMNTLDATANSEGLETYKDDPDLVAARKVFVDNLKQELPAWEVDFSQFDSGAFERNLGSLAELSSSNRFRNSTRTDMAGVQQYLQMRNEFVSEMNEIGISATSAEAAPFREEFAARVNSLVSQNTMFSEYAFYPFLERDPLLGEAA